MKVILWKPHTHAGVDYPAGAEIDVDEATAFYLVMNGTAKEAEKPEEKKIKPSASAKASADYPKEDNENEP